MSLKTGLVLAIASILVGTLVVASWLASAHVAGKLDTEMTSALTAGRKAVELQREDVLRSSDPRRELERIVRTFDGHRHLAVMATDADGKQIAHSKPEDVTQQVPDWFNRRIAPELRREIFPFASGEQTIGTIVLTADPTNETAEAWSDARLNLSTLAIFCTATLAILTALLKSALDPVTKLLQGFQSIGAGNFGVQVPVSGANEMEELARGFNRMSSLLENMTTDTERLNRQLETVQEEERASLARDLHDDVGPLLFSIDVDALSIKDRLASGDTATALERTATIQDAVAATKEQIRSILWQLRPGILMDLGLANAIEDLAAYWQAKTPGLTFDLDVPAKTWTPQIDVTLHAVVREAVNNALRHGTPKTIRISIGEREPGWVEAQISDDGGGLKPPSPLGSFGLTGMKERAARAGGTLTVTDRADRPGVSVMLRLPLATAANATDADEQTKVETA